MDAYECDGCGACCRTWRVLVSETDAEREPRIREEGRRLPEHTATSFWGYQIFPLPFHEGCCFLDEKQRCGVYETRPQVCRDFEAGGPRCQEAREGAGMPPLLPIEPGDPIRGREDANGGRNRRAPGL